MELVIFLGPDNKNISYEKFENRYVHENDNFSKLNIFMLNVEFL